MIYVPTDAYLSHGRDDFLGGKAHVAEVREELSAGLKVHYIRIKERPDYLYSWTYLSQQQEELKKKFSDQEAHPDPDYRPQFNEW